MESGRPLQKEINRLFLKPVSLTSLLQVRILPCNLLFSMFSLRYVLGGPGAAGRGVTSVDKLLRTIASFSHRVQQILPNSHRDAVGSSEMSSLTAEAGNFCERLEEPEAHRHYLRI